MRSRGRRSAAWPVLAVLATTMAAACVELTVDTSELGAIEMVPPASPSIVAGDTLRDAAGVVAPLQVRVYSAGGDLLTDREIRFVSTDTLVSVDDAGFVVARESVRGIARVYATVDSRLQSIPLAIEVVAPPESLVANTPDRLLHDTITYQSRPVVIDDTSMALAVRVRAGGSDVVGVPQWIVRYALEYQGQVLAPSDTAVFAVVEVVGSVARVMPVDTTDASGIASRRLRVRITPGTILDDSVTIRASATLRGAPLQGSPVEFMVRVRPAP